jgi:acetyltransferase
MPNSHFDFMFAPGCVALVGASERPGSVGAVTLRNLRSGGFRGSLYLVNPKHETIGGARAYPGLKQLPVVPELAVIATPRDQVANVVRDLASIGAKAAVVITAGFAELGERGKAMQREIVEAAGPVRLVGPNCIGIIVPAAGLNASFAHLMPESGDLAFVSQSGALVTAVLDWAQPRGIGFSKVVSLGDMADVDFGDMLEYFANDVATRAVLLYIEGVADAGKIMRAARAASRAKPVVVMKVGRHQEAARAARSHTGALAGSDVVYDAAFRRAGMLRVDSLTEMFDAVETLALTSPQRGDRVTIVTNGGGPGVLATDALIAAGGKLAELAPETLRRLDALLPATWSRANPVDMVGDATAEDYAKTLGILFADPGSDAFVVMNCPTALTSPSDAARGVIDAVADARDRCEERNVFTVWLGERTAAPSRTLFERARIPTYDTPDDAVRGFMHRVRYEQSQALSQTSPASGGFVPDDAAVSTVIERALAAERPWLDVDDVERVLDAYGIARPASRSAGDADAAAAAAAYFGLPVALKLRSPDITHKSDAGAVVLGLNGADQVRAAALAMLERIEKSRPDARIEGFFVQEMVRRPDAIELIAGMSIDPVFGPVVLFGHGGTAVEVIADTSLELVPLDLALARAQIERTNVARLLRGYRGRPAADIEQIATVLTRIGMLTARHPEIVELDINPLLADAQGVIALDARIGVARSAHVALALLSHAELVAVGGAR